MEFKAYAKINLCLDVVNKRPDGYHNVDMIMVQTGLYDVLNIELTNDGIINFVCDNPMVTPPPKNLCYRSALAFFEHTGISHGCNITLTCNIPLCAGLGGGSSDAAATLKALNTLCDNPLTDSQLLSIGKTIGADVPFCIMGGTARAEGIGEILTAIDSRLDKWAVLIKPDVTVSTPEAYSEMDKCTYPHPDTAQAAQALANGNTELFYNLAGNSFEHIICSKHSEIAEIKNHLASTGAEFAMMSGSGPTVFGLFADKETAQSAFDSYTGSFSGGGVVKLASSFDAVNP